LRGAKQRGNLAASSKTGSSLLRCAGNDAIPSMEAL
jgi:hypothetical protein